MTNSKKTKRFLFDGDILQPDIEQMEYWHAVRNSEIDRCIRVVNNWQNKQEKHNDTNCN